MTISSTTIIDKIEVLQNGVLQIRQAQILTENNQEIARNYTRWTRVPGDQEAQSDPIPVPAIASAIWTSNVISAYQSELIAQKTLIE